MGRDANSKLRRRREDDYRLRGRASEPSAFETTRVGRDRGETPRLSRSGPSAPPSDRPCTAGDHQNIGKETARLVGLGDDILHRDALAGDDSDERDAVVRAADGFAQVRATGAGTTRPSTTGSAAVAAVAARPRATLGDSVRP